MRLACAKPDVGYAVMFTNTSQFAVLASTSFIRSRPARRSRPIARLSLSLYLYLSFVRVLIASSSFADLTITKCGVDISGMSIEARARCSIDARSRSTKRIRESM